MERAYEVSVMSGGVNYWYYFGNTSLEQVELVLNSDYFAHIIHRNYVIIANEQSCNEFVDSMHKLMKDYPIKAFVIGYNDEGYFEVVELKKGGD